jgi:hypothetical protein
MIIQRKREKKRDYKKDYKRDYKKSNISTQELANQAQTVLDKK